MNPDMAIALKTDSGTLLPPAAYLEFLRGLTAGSPPPSGREPADPAPLAAWLIDNQLGAFAAPYADAYYPELAALLKPEQYLVAAENHLRFRKLRELLAALDEKGFPVVLLKGAALAHTVYADPALRAMADLDLWVERRHMAAVIDTFQALGFSLAEQEMRPLALQEMANGEVQMYHPQWLDSGVEIHWSAFPGWWLTDAAAVDHPRIWSRKEPLPIGGLPAYQLSPEDTIIELAAHLVINHQFGLAALRSLIDIALTIAERPVDWRQVTADARAWRLSVCLWLTLSQAAALFPGLDGVEAVVRQLRPSPLRRWLLRRFVTPDSILAGRNLQDSRWRYLFLILVVDRPLSVLQLMRRTLWPDRDWLVARYGENPGRLRHLKNLLAGLQF